MAGGAGAPAPAQSPPDSAPSLSVELRRDSAGALRPPLVRARGWFDQVFEGALRNGFPVRFSFRLTLWRDAALFDRLDREASWDAVVLLDPLTNSYELIRSDGSIRSFTRPADVAAALATPYAVDLLPTRSGRHYYTASLIVESLSVSELEEVERWLRGDLGRALTERGDVGNALSRGARLALIRLSGLPRRVSETRTPTFTP